MDLILRNATIVDGTGAPRFAGDIGIAGDRIARIGALTGVSAACEIDLGGLVAAPGFIDTHTHDDAAVLRSPHMAAKISQGVTTIVTGNCGLSLAPHRADRDVPQPLDILGDRAAFAFASFADYLAAVEAAPPAVNVAALVGHTSLRVDAMDDLSRPASDPEIARMAEGLRDALDAGAIGLSTGVFYPPAAAAATGEIEALVTIVGAAGGVYATHLRNESDRVLEAVDEAIGIAARGAAPLIISHHKAYGRANFGKTAETLARIEAAAVRQPILLDAYPYTSGSSMLLEALWKAASRTVITSCDRYPEMNGADVADIALAWQCSEEEAVARLIPARAIYELMDEADVSRVLAFPATMIGSDGLPGDDHPHPRLWGTFPRVLGRYARARSLFSLEEAVRKMTGLPAAGLGFTDRGLIAEGAFADIAVFDADMVSDCATVAAPTRPSTGIHSVIVNGRMVWANGAATGLLPGRLLRRAERTQ